MPDRISYIGRSFGRYKIIADASDRIRPNGKKARYFIALCQCGTEFEITQSSLSDPRHVSCGCANRDRQAAQREDWETAFWSKVDKNGPVPTHRPELGPCWIFNGCLDPKGYGVFGARKLHKHPMRAHRVAWWSLHGKPPDNLGVLHRCDNPRCCNAERHLFLGDAQVNVDDMIAKGRAAVGINQPGAKLTDDKVIDIRRLVKIGGLSQTAIAAQFGVSRKVIRRIASGESWCHVKEVGPAPAEPTS